MITDVPERRSVSKFIVVTCNTIVLNSNLDYTIRFVSQIKSLVLRREIKLIEKAIQGL